MDLGLDWKPSESQVRARTEKCRLQRLCHSLFRPSSGKLWVNKPGRFTYETVVASIRDFLENNPLEEGFKYYMVMDNAPWHRKVKRLIKENLNGIYQDIVDKVVFVYLPPYSPDLNPIEQVWRIVRREVTHNRYFATLEDLTKPIDDYFALYAKPNQKFSSLCSFHFHKRNPKIDSIA